MNERTKLLLGAEPMEDGRIQSCILMTGGVFVGLDFRGADFSGASLSGCHFYGCTFPEDFAERARVIERCEFVECGWAPQEESER